MQKVKTMEEAYRVFELLGIKDVTKKWQKNKGTEVWELPLKTMYNNGSTEINRFTIYKNGYVRKMIVYGENNATKSCYQLNRVRKVANFVKDYKWDDSKTNVIWTGKYRKIYNNERIMIDNHRDRVIYLCNYILKNYYNSKMSLVGDYTRLRVREVHGKFWRQELEQNPLPFNGDEHDLVEKVQNDVKIEGKYSEICDYVKDDIQVIINGHRYNLK